MFSKGLQMIQQYLLNWNEQKMDMDLMVFHKKNRKKWNEKDTASLARTDSLYIINIL